MINVEVCAAFVYKSVDGNVVDISLGFEAKDGKLFLPHTTASPANYLVEYIKAFVSKYTRDMGAPFITPGGFYDPYELDKERKLADPIHLVYEVHITQPIEELEFLNYGNITNAVGRFDRRHYRVSRGVLHRLNGY